MNHKSHEVINISNEVLGKRLRLLLDTVLAESGHRYTYKEVNAAMLAVDTPLSRARWHYLREGTGPKLKDDALLTNLAIFFNVPVDYLLREDTELPQRVEDQLGMLKTMKEGEVRYFAARQLSNLSPETLRQIRDLIDEELSQNKDQI